MSGCRSEFSLPDIDAVLTSDRIDAAEIELVADARMRIRIISGWCPIAPK
jgi:hypothetical protein